jgi:hypothetical protein
LREGPAQSRLRKLADALPAGDITLYQARLRTWAIHASLSEVPLAPEAPLLNRQTQSARADPIDLPALIVAVIVIVPERVAESEALEATMMRESPAGTAEAMTAEPAAQAAEMSGAQRPTEVRAGTQTSAAHPATEVATTHPAQVSPAHSAAEMATTHPTAEMATTHSTAEMTAATATATMTTTAAARPCVGRDAGASHRYGHRDHRDFVQREYPHDISFRPDDFDSSPQRPAPAWRSDADARDLSIIPPDVCSI